MIKPDVVVIGGGIAGLSAAGTCAKAGAKVLLLEKNDWVGGRMGSFSEKGFVFDTGPSWYWMPEIFDQFFESFGKNRNDFYSLKRLDPSYRVVFPNNENLNIPAGSENVTEMFDGLEPGAGKALNNYLAEAEVKYRLGMRKWVRKPALSPLEFVDLEVAREILRLDVFGSFAKHVRKHFKDSRLIKLMEFPSLFLGGTPKSTPALYSLMNYADIGLGTWYPDGGMVKIAEAMRQTVEEAGVIIKTGEAVKEIQASDGVVKKILTETGEYGACTFVSGADYRHTETLLPENYRAYTDEYWDKRVLAPSCLLFFLGISKRVPNIEHHTLFFDEDLDDHVRQIYNDPKWPDKPLFYVCAPSKTDKSVAPEGCENLFVLMPIAPGLEDSPGIRERYFKILMDRLEEHTGENLLDSIIVKKSFAVSDFEETYNAYKGNAYGLANTLTQTAFLKPKIRNPKLRNMYYAGQLTIPGPGLPPSLISGQVVAEQMAKDFPGLFPEISSLSPLNHNLA
ncbi:phytoene dehydrogenase [Fulvitalea axinellae]|uniref:Phytoene dehydrogenase n=1 Tax=Fulvitalea axinellae TaxID=1182444 RepID=A0AAU9CGM3_9BACT|nr:phytoene dehydrogenase [Fulvitalea axinellae]